MCVCISVCVYVFLCKCMCECMCVCMCLKVKLCQTLPTHLLLFLIYYTYNLPIFSLHYFILTTCIHALLTRVGPDNRFCRISGRIPDIEIFRPDIQYCRIFSHTLLKLSGWLSDNLVPSFKPDIRPNPNL